ncbi:glycogen debranching protein [Enterocloster asparagiformis]|nr:alpha-amylase family glycosyl hydrolase [Enterocloster asparagiformis]RGX30058.1 glycogen debranching enzyme [Enterocloster asparagiformis]UWO79636.1 alpha-amylase family glycosyl hydrolase [[Clostridium] asparagiforme DSM 15981]
MNGATLLQDGVNFTVHTHSGTACELLLFNRGEKDPYAVLPFPEEYKIGNVYSMIVFGLDIGEFEYAYRVDGPNDPGAGLLFDRDQILLDPYAKAVTGQSVWGEKQEPGCTYRARVVKNNFDWGDMPQSGREMSDLVIYELHVRGFTRHSSSGVAHPGTFAGILEKIPYLKDLGVNAVELMPVFEFDETMGGREVNGRKLLDYWGYNTVGFFAPNTSYTAGLEYNREGTEFKNLIRTLHENGIEVILDVVFNHTAEGNEKGPVISFKGFDNNIYYMLTPDGYYYNFSGCGNTLNCNHPIVQQMIVECLRYWTVDYRVDGFRFDLASILGRNEDGSPMNNPPLLQRLAFDPILGNVKLIAEAWDAGGLYQVGTFPAWKRWAEWNGKYRDTLREFLKGGTWAAGEAARRITGSGDLYNGHYAGYNSSVNFITCHDGFTLYDLYAYNEKHNQENGWGNTDGADDNRSWNCGAEGPTDDKEVLDLRFRMMRNACAVLMCSRGTPMFFAGDEFGNTQLGNNNAYCQDNEISWLNWELLKENEDLFGFFRFMIRFRMNHPAIRRDLPGAVCGLPALTVYGNGGENRVDDGTAALGILYAGYDRKRGRDDVVYLAVNVYWEDVNIQLPELPKYLDWYAVVNTAGDGQSRFCYRCGERSRVDSGFRMRPRSVAVFTVNGNQ